MHFSALTLTVLAAALCAAPIHTLAQSSSDVRVTYNTTYDDASTPLTSLACDDGQSVGGLIDLGQLPNFPFVGGSSAVAG